MEPFHTQWHFSKEVLIICLAMVAAPFKEKENRHSMHPISILSLNRRISFINVGKYKKEYRKVTDSGRDRRSGRIFRVLFFQTI